MLATSVSSFFLIMRNSILGIPLWENVSGKTSLEKFLWENSFWKIFLGKFFYGTLFGIIGDTNRIIGSNRTDYLKYCTPDSKMGITRCPSIFLCTSYPVRSMCAIFPNT